jgi:hypothetical protein
LVRRGGWLTGGEAGFEKRSDSGERAELILRRAQDEVFFFQKILKPWEAAGLILRQAQDDGRAFGVRIQGVERRREAGGDDPSMGSE